MHLAYFYLEKTHEIKLKHITNAFQLGYIS